MMGVVEVRPGSDGAPVLGSPEELMRELDDAVERLGRDNAKHPSVPTIPLHIRALAEEARWSIEYEKLSPEETAAPEPAKTTRRGWSWEEWERSRREAESGKVPPRVWIRWAATGAGVGLAVTITIFGAIEAVPRLTSPSNVWSPTELELEPPIPLAANEASETQKGQGEGLKARASTQGRHEATNPFAIAPDPTNAAGSSALALLDPPTPGPIARVTTSPSPVTAPKLTRAAITPTTTLAPKPPPAPRVERAKPAAAPKRSNASNIAAAVAALEREAEAEPDPQRGDLRFDDEAGELEVEVVREVTEVEAPFDDPAEADFDEFFGVASSGTDVIARRTVYLPPDPAVPPSRALTQQQILAVVLAHKAEVARCVDAQRAAKPDSSGELLMTWRIEPDGTTRDVKTRTDSLRGSVVATCVEDQIAGWRFPATAGGNTPVVFPFRF